MAWKYETGDDVYSSPALVNGKVYVGSRDGYVYSLNSSNGGLIWKYKLGDYLRGEGWGLPDSSPAVADGRVYIGSGDNCTYCLDASTGSFVWRYRTRGVVQSSPAVAEGRVYVGSLDESIYCLNASTGDLVWRYEAPSSIRSSPAVADGKVFVSTYTWIYCLDAYSGSLIWKRSLGSWYWGYEPRWCSSPAVAYGRVYVGSWDENLYCLDPTTGNIIWNYTTGGDVKSSPAVADDKVYIGSQDGYLYCLDAHDGSLIWRYDTDSSMISSPAVANGRAYVGAGNLRVYCFSAKIESAISCSVSHEEINQDESITVSGSITPAMEGVTVTLMYKKPDDTTFDRTVTTASDGSYSDLYKPTETGAWNVKASWKGDPEHEGASSQQLAFNVEEKKVPIEEEKKKGCIIATATYGSELSPEVQLLRGFRDNALLNTFAGHNLITVFNAWYYSFSPAIASIIAGNNLLRGFMKIILYPLIGVLHLAAITYSLFSFNPELAVVASGLVASSLLGIIYFAPIVLILCLVKKLDIPIKTLHVQLLIWVVSVGGMTVAEIIQWSGFMMFSSTIFVLSTMSFAILLSVRLFMRLTYA